MTVHTSATVTIEAAKEQVLAVLRDFPGQVQWWPGTLSAEVVQTDANGWPSRAHYVRDVKIAKDEYEAEYVHSDSGMTWQLAAPSKAQRDMSGSWEVTGDAGACEITLSLTIDTTLPLPKFVQKKVIDEIVAHATGGLKRFVEVGPAETA